MIELYIYNNNITGFYVISLIHLVITCMFNFLAPTGKWEAL